ncbi:MAG: type 1 glutamine amidotransferase [Hydrogenophaga sp.]|uniref:type 1 glutamine amidotransferase n=1 Tax=Hydrogenophaga sp. TaxID=1904254 RepID=UPI00260F3034|nr:type 1 glutamine amidotransferase [Hydrogenophaga sp.]MDD3785048.1 type 1 glutamine amidotransferase [Hydrogenophaga sp.]
MASSDAMDLMGVAGHALSSLPMNAEVLVLQHTLEDHPGFLGQWLDREQIRWDVFCAEAGQAYPGSVAGYRGVAVLGGEWSANDERPSLRQVEALIREADTLGIPVIGHCLGGQLMARAFGGRVERLPLPEVGWWTIDVLASDAARAWFGDAAGRTVPVFQWHYDGVTTLPPGAEVLASSPACTHQAFAIGPHLAMQFHIEIDPGKIDAWLNDPGTVYPAAVREGIPTAQPPETTRAITARHQPESEALAHQIYRAWRSRWR